MARNGSGVYSLPSGLPSNGEVSNATDDIITPFQDLETDMNTARPVVAGGTGATSASAARTSLAVPGKAATETITGDWTFSGTVSGITADSVADDAVTTAKIADSAVTSAKIADGTIATADIADDAVTDAKVLNPSGLVFIQSQDASSSATLDFTGFDATKYDSYVFKLANLIPSTDDKILTLRTSTDGGSTYASSAGNYQYALQAITSGAGGTGTATQSSSATSIFLTALGMGNAATEDGVSGSVEIHGPHIAKETMVTCITSGIDGASGNFSNSQGGGVRLSQADVDAVRFLFVTGNITSGTITMYGMRNS